MNISASSRCNFHCVICCNNSTSEGNDMAPETLRAIVDKFAVKMIKRGEPLVLAGGEPTLNPNLFEMIEIGRNAGLDVYVLTNGSITDSALRLCEMAKRGEIIAKLSLDKWKSKISPAVIKAWISNPRLQRSQHTGRYAARHAQETIYLFNRENLNDRRAISICLIPAPEGRAKTSGLVTRPQYFCKYGNILVRWNGEFTTCGGKWGPCNGHVYHGNILDDEAVKPYLPIFDEPYGEKQNV